METPVQKSRIEPRWPVALTILAVILILALLPRFIRLLPAWVPFVLGAVVLMPIAAVGLTSGQTRWLRVERTATLVFFVVGVVVILANLANVLHAMVHKSTEITGVQLLAASMAAWVANVLMFSLLYWQIDRGGPEARVSHSGARKDWFFPQEGDAVSAAPAEWQPTFVDYLYLAYQTATAFSTTDVAPLTHRAKLLMMFESAISLATILVVAARAINILGG